MSRGRARDPGVDVQRRAHGFRPKSELIVEERRKYVQKARPNSSCRGCGQKGHWAGDPEYPRHGQTQPKPFHKKAFASRNDGTGKKQLHKVTKPQFRNHRVANTAVIEKTSLEDDVDVPSHKRRSRLPHRRPTVIRRRSRLPCRRPTVTRLSQPAQHRDTDTDRERAKTLTPTFRRAVNCRRCAYQTMPSRRAR